MSAPSELTNAKILPRTRRPSVPNMRPMSTPGSAEVTTRRADRRARARGPSHRRSCHHGRARRGRAVQGGSGVGPRTRRGARRAHPGAVQAAVRRHALGAERAHPAERACSVRTHDARSHAACPLERSASGPHGYPRDHPADRATTGEGSDAMSKRTRTLTPLAVTALALLEERPMHPYEMLQLLRLRGKDAVLTIKPGSFYHTVARLAELGLADVHSTGRDGNRPERTLYALTERGHEAIVRWVRDAPRRAVHAAGVRDRPRRGAQPRLRRGRRDPAGPARRGSAPRRAELRGVLDARRSQGHPLRLPPRGRPPRRPHPRRRRLDGVRPRTPHRRRGGLARHPSRPLGGRHRQLLGAHPVTEQNTRARGIRHRRPPAARGPPSGRSSSASS